MASPPPLVVLLFAEASERDRSMAEGVIRQFAPLLGEKRLQLMSPSHVPFSLNMEAALRDAIHNADLVLLLTSVDFINAPLAMASFEYALECAASMFLVRLRDSILPTSAQGLPDLVESLPIANYADPDIANTQVVQAVLGRLQLLSPTRTRSPFPPNLPTERDLWFVHLAGLNCGTESYAHAEVQQLQSDLASFGSVQFDGLILCGGPVSRPERREYDVAQVHMKRLQDALRLSPERTAVVPGAHDVSPAGTTRSDFDEFCQQLAAQPTTAPSAEWTLLRTLGPRLFLLGLNSGAQPAQPGRIHRVAVEHALAQLPPRAVHASQLRLAAWFHSRQGPSFPSLPDPPFLPDLVAAGFRVLLCGQASEGPLAETFPPASASGLRLFAASRLHYNVLRLRGRTLSVFTRRRNVERAMWRPDACHDLALD